MFSPSSAAAETEAIVVYGSTPAGIMAAVAARRSGGNVILLSSTPHIGGMVSSGLSATDDGINRTIGGLARDFFNRVGWRYGKSSEWNFEPHVAESVFRAILKERGLVVVDFELDRVEVENRRISAMISTSGKKVFGKVFIDATYEGDLLAKAGVDFRVGRESAAELGEELAGFQLQRSVDKFPLPVSGKIGGQTLPGVLPDSHAAIGDADSKIMAYNYRLCVTNAPKHRTPFPKPEHYEAVKFELLLRYLETVPLAQLTNLFNFLPLQKHKFDLNNRGPVSSDLIGGADLYPQASPSEREAIRREHRDYLLGFWRTLQDNPRVPKRIRDESRNWGLCSDEFRSTNNWPPLLYVREARRMRGEYVLKQQDLQTDTRKPDSIGMASRPIESHHVQRFLAADESVMNEGFVYPLSKSPRPYEIPYRSLVPKRDEVENLIVPVCVSASHIAYSSLRMEPVYMILGHAAGLAAFMAVENSKPVQNIDVAELRRRLSAEGQVLSDPGKKKRP